MKVNQSGISRADLSNIAREIARDLPDSPSKSREIWRLEKLARETSGKEFELLRKSTKRKDLGCQTIEIVLRKKEKGRFQPFVTHVHALETNDYLWGNYFSSLEDANEDFEQRCREYKLRPEEAMQ